MKFPFANECAYGISEANRLFEKSRECLEACDQVGRGRGNILNAGPYFFDAGRIRLKESIRVISEWGIFDATECLKVGDHIGVARNLRSVYDLANGAVFQAVDNHENLEISISRMSRKEFFCFLDIAPAEYTVSSDGLIAHLCVSVYGDPFVLVKGLDGYALVTYSESSSACMEGTDCEVFEAH